MDIALNVISAAKATVDLVVSQAKGVKAVVICTEDGFEVATHVENTAQISRLSAMASSISALGALAGEESALGECNNVIIEAENGLVLILQVRRPNQPLIMSVIAGNDAVIGQVLYFSKQAARALEQV